MNKAAIITLAGTSSRFSKSVGYECHKSFYRETPEDVCLLDWQIGVLRRCGFSQIVLVGGYKYDELESIVKESYSDLPIVLVRNDRYSDLGSGHSLCLGIEALPDDMGAVVFLEGDLLFDAKTFEELVSSDDDAITATRSIVDAKTSVAFYISQTGALKYIYDTRHSVLKVDEPFTRIGNSGQVWQFSDIRRLKKVVLGLSDDERAGTNLVPILKYYGNVDGNKIRVCQFNAWFNCNTIADYHAMRDYVKEETNGSNK